MQLSKCLTDAPHLAGIVSRRTRRQKRVYAGAVPARRSLSDKPTISSVADRADVAISTVSRVVNGGHTSEGIRRRVQRAIDELGYAPSVTARSLVTRRTGCIGLAANTTQSAWFTQVLAGVEETLATCRTSVLLASTTFHDRHDPSVVAGWIQEHRIDGLILVRYSARDEALLTSAAAKGIPTVLIAPDADVAAAHAVRSNNVQAGRLVAQHLAELGHRKIGFGGGPAESLDTRDRLRGLTLGLQERGIDLAPELVRFGASYTRDAGMANASWFLGLPVSQRPTAMVLGNDAIALAFMRTLLQHGVRVPTEVSAVGFDGIPDGEQCWPGLTTVTQPTLRMARDACRTLLRRVEANSSSPDDADAIVEYDVSLLLRESTAAPGTSAASDPSPSTSTSTAS
jgi:LacI family transcriptional regulator, galactose operon repressor